MYQIGWILTWSMIFVLSLRAAPAFETFAEARAGLRQLMQEKTSSQWLVEDANRLIHEWQAGHFRRRMWAILVQRRCVTGSPGDDSAVLVEWGMGRQYRSLWLGREFIYFYSTPDGGLTFRALRRSPETVETVAALRKILDRSRCPGNLSGATLGSPIFIYTVLGDKKVRAFLLHGAAIQSEEHRSDEKASPAQAERLKINRLFRKIKKDSGILPESAS